MADDSGKDSATLLPSQLDGSEYEKITPAPRCTRSGRVRFALVEETPSMGKRTLRKNRRGQGNGRSVIQSQNSGVKKSSKKFEYVLSATALRELGEAASATLFSGNVTIAADKETSFAVACQVYRKPLAEATREFVLWTDGSCSQDSTGASGAAVVFKDHPHSETWIEVPFLVLGQKSIHDVELIAVERALNIAVQQYPQQAGQNTVVIFSDSTTVLQWIQRGRVTRGYQSMETLKRIYKLADELVAMGCRVDLHWVKGHGRARGNRRADAVADMIRKYFINVDKKMDTITTYDLGGDLRAPGVLWEKFREEGNIADSAGYPIEYEDEDDVADRLEQDDEMEERLKGEDIKKTGVKRIELEEELEEGEIREY